MITISTKNSSDWTEAQIYQFGGIEALFQTPCVALKKFHVGMASLGQVANASMIAEDHANTEYREKRLREIYSGPAPFGNKERIVSFHRRKYFCRLDFEKSPVCELDLQNLHIHLLRPGGFDNFVNVELLTGPAMMLLLARLKTYCLHASAVSTSAGVVAFIGESGAGKSTLAWEAGDAWRQLSDDILPILYEKDRRGVHASAQFPQLKLEMAASPSFSLGDLNLEYIFRINPEPTAKVAFRRMPKSEAMLQFARHTVAARLFNEKMMDRHVKFATYVANRVPMIELSYPRDLLQITSLREEIVEYLADMKNQGK